jgi:hypothetical protein
MARLQILTASEAREFNAMDKVVDDSCRIKGREASWEMLSALRVIRSGRLFREKCTSFFSYLKMKGLNQSTVSKGLSALEVKDLIEEKLWLYDKARVGMIMSERCLRELVGLDGDEIPEVFRMACQDAGDSDVTMRHLKDARAKLAPRGLRRKVERVDESGEQVPDFLAEAFAARYALLDISSKIKSIVIELQSLSSRPGGEYLQFDVLHSELSKIGHAIAQSGFGVTCIECCGTGCVKCRSTGYIPKRRLRGE